MSVPVSISPTSSTWGVPPTIAATETAQFANSAADRLTALEERQDALLNLNPAEQWFLLISLVNGLMYALTEVDPEGALERHRKALAYSVEQERLTRPKNHDATVIEAGGV